eukprot:Hpha_TRINITY_DN9053_c0_g2::TRINITY_DN9053_c0_g2_i1::g.141938::m.141938
MPEPTYDDEDRREALEGDIDAMFTMGTGAESPREGAEECQMVERDDQESLIEHRVSVGTGGFESYEYSDVAAAAENHSSVDGTSSVCLSNEPIAPCPTKPGPNPLTGLSPEREKGKGRELGRDNGGMSPPPATKAP